MIQVTPQMRIRVAVEPADFRKGIDGLASLCRGALCSDPFSGCVFVFCNKSRKAIKILVYDGQGFLVMSEAALEGAVPVVAAERLIRHPGPSSSSACRFTIRGESSRSPRGSPVAPGGWGSVRRKEHIRIRWLVKNVKPKPAFVR